MRLTTAISMGVLVMGSAMVLYAEPPAPLMTPPATKAQPVAPVATKPEVMGNTIEGTIQQLDLKATPSLLTVQRADGSLTKVEAYQASVRLVRSEKTGGPKQAAPWSQLKAGQRVKIGCSMQGEKCIAHYIELLD